MEDEEALWRKLREHGDKEARNTLIEAYHPLARTIAAKLYSARIDEDIEFDDYLQYAELGLIESTDRYDPDNSAQFSTYAAYRIRGAILNGIEKYSEKREQLAFRKRYLNDRVNSLSKKTSKVKHRDAFAELVEITVGMALSYMLEGTGQVEEKPQKEVDTVYENNAIRELQKELIGYVDLLPEREQLIIRYHYFQHVGFGELAAILDISKGRVSQLHKSAILELKRLFEKNRNLDSYY
jgi:RNA polymerase sigma factor for flagellar operon FliA